MTDKFRYIILEYLGKEYPLRKQLGISDDTKFEDLGLDSLDIGILAIDLEKSYGVMIPDEWFQDHTTFGQLRIYCETSKK